MRALPDRERLILHMRFVEDMTQSQIAERIGISQMHVSRLIRKALEAMRSTYDARLSRLRRGSAPSEAVAAASGIAREQHEDRGDDADDRGQRRAPRTARNEGCGYKHGDYKTDHLNSSA